METNLSLRTALWITTKQKEQTARLKAVIEKSIAETQIEIETTKKTLQSLELRTTSNGDASGDVTREAMIGEGREIIKRVSESLIKQQRLYDEVSNTHMECQREILKVRSRLNRNV